jgi:hypothetical protein
MSRPKKPMNDAPKAEARGEKAKPSYQALYERYKPVGARLAEEEVQSFRGDPRLVLVNVKRGVEAVCGAEEQVRAAREHLPKLPVNGVLELPDLARALLFAARQVPSRTASPKEIEKALEETSGPREDLLKQAELFVRRGLLDKQRVKDIRKGSGKFDMAEDGMALAALFAEHAEALKGRHPFTAEEIEQLRRTSEWLIDNLNPAGARAESKKRGRSPAEDARDRLWTLVVRRHEHLRKIAYYFHGDEWEEVAPRLLSRVKGRKAGEEVEEEEPAAEESAEAEDGAEAEESAEAEDEEQD